MKKIFITFMLVFAMAYFVGFSAFAQNSTIAPYRQQMKSLMEEFRNAKTDDERNTIHARMKEAREQYRIANPPRELPLTELEARKKMMEEKLQKDPYRWEMYQLRQTMGNATSQEARESYRAKMQALMAKHMAEEEAKLTPNQRAAVQARQAKNIQMQAELKPLIEQMHSAKNDDERRAIHSQMREVFRKYR